MTPLGKKLFVLILSGPVVWLLFNLVLPVAFPAHAQGPCGSEPIWVSASGWYNIREKPWATSDSEILGQTKPGQWLGIFYYEDHGPRGRWVKVFWPINGWIILRGVTSSQPIPQRPAQPWWKYGQEVSSNLVPAPAGSKPPTPW